MDSQQSASQNGFGAEYLLYLVDMVYGKPFTEYVGANVCHTRSLYSLYFPANDLCNLVVKNTINFNLVCSYAG